jgi:hypothetical protein
MNAEAKTIVAVGLIRLIAFAYSFRPELEYEIVPDPSLDLDRDQQIACQHLALREGAMGID